MLVLASSGLISAVDEVTAKAEYDAALKSDREAEAAITPLRAIMQKADTAYAEARKVADAKRQQAIDASNLAGEPGVRELKRAEDSLDAALKALTDATNAKPPLDKALADAKADALPSQQSYDAAEKAAKEAEALAKGAADSANKLDDEAKKATAQATAKRRAADSAKGALARAQQAEQNFQNQIDAAPRKLGEAETQKKAADDALAKAKDQVSAAMMAYQTAESAAAETNTKRYGRSKSQKEQAMADAAKAALAQARTAQKNSQNLADTAAQKLARAEEQKNQAVDALASAKNQIAAATAAFQAAGQAAQDSEKSAGEKNRAAADAATRRKAAADTGVALTQAQQGEQQAQAQVAAAAQKLTEARAQQKSADETLVNVKNQVAADAAASLAAEQAAQSADAKAKQVAGDTAKPDAEKTLGADEFVAKRKASDDARAALAKARQSEQQAQAQATTAAQKLAEAEAQKKSGDEALAKASNQVAAATTADQAAREAGKEVIQFDTVAKQSATDAAAKRKAANEAKTTLDPKAKALEKTALQANNAAQELARSETRKKSGEEDLENLKKRIASAKQTFEADEKAAQAAEAAAAPLKEEAEKTRPAYTEATKVADIKHTLVDQAKNTLYRLVSARQVAKIMESTEPPVPANRIDEIVFAKLKALGIHPVLCSDAVFARRACLDLTGMLPSAEEAKAFIQDSDKNKRVALIDRLLDRSEHVDYWAMKWSDILKVKAEFPVKLWPNAAQAYHRWIWDSIARNKPYDQFVRELLTSGGSNFRDGPVNFYRAIQEKTPEGIAAAVGLAVMGTRVLLWPAERRAGMAVFFSQIGYKPTSEWKEEIVFWDPLKSVAVPGSIAPGVDSVAKAVAATNMIPQALPNVLTEPGPVAAVFPDGTKTTIPPNRDPREVFADWLIRPENPWFAKAIVNRTWACAMGRGIIHEPDDIRENNPPSNPKLLAYLEKELVSSGYNLKSLKRLIFTSTAYQFSSIQRSKAPQASANFASYKLRRVEAEVLIDELNEITGGSDLYTSAVPEPFTYIPHDMTAVELADGSVTSSFLTLFGRSSRATGMESERVSELASTQCLHMLNSAAIQRKLQDGPKLAAILSQGGKPNEIAERLYLTILSRLPTDADLETVGEYAKSGATKGNGVWVDVAWSLINSPEFLLRH